MYRCIRDSPEDSYMQCLVWRDFPQYDLSVLKLEALKYGTKPASYLAVRSIHQLSMDEEAAFQWELRFFDVTFMLII